MKHQLSAGCNQLRHTFGAAQLKLGVSKRNNLVFAA